jgi:hypothetical protein
MKKMIAAALSVLVMSGCVAPIDYDTLFDDDSAPLTSTRDAGADAAAEVPDAAPPPPAVDKDAACFPLVWIDGVDVNDFTCQGTIMVCPVGAPMIDACYGAIPWGGNVTIHNYRPTCCPTK